MTRPLPLVLLSLLLAVWCVHTSAAKRSKPNPLSSFYDVDPSKFIEEMYFSGVHSDAYSGSANAALHGTAEEAQAAVEMLLGPQPAASTGKVYVPAPIDDSIYPVCANVSYRAGNPDISKTLYECVENIADPLLTPSYLNGSDTRTVLVAYSFNNLMELNELDGTVTMDFYFRLYWLDQRINVPSMWEAIDNTTANFMIVDGVCIDPLVRNENNNLELWLPDMQFVDGKEVESLEETLKLRPGGIMFWSRHLVATMQQPGFVYYQYPMDTQVIGVRIESYGYNSHSMLLGFADASIYYPGTNTTITTVKPVSFIKNGDTENFNTNQMWTYESYYTEVLTPDYGTSSVAAFFAQPVVYLRVSRKSSGIINRLALPIMLMLMLVGMTFWKEMETRVDTTITILLAVSALYIVIFSNVPPIGYLTKFDTYIIEMFIMLVVTVFAHQLVDRLMVKADRYPLRMLTVRIIEYLGKQFIIPFVILVFVVTFSTLFDGDNDVLEWEDVTGIIIAISSISVYIFVREYTGLKRANRDCLLLIRVKVASPSAYELSTAEMLYFNYFSYGVCSRSASHYHRWLRTQEKTYAEEDRLRAASNASGDGDGDAGPPTAAEGNALPRTAKEMMRAWDNGDKEIPVANQRPRSITLSKRGGKGPSSDQLNAEFGGPGIVMSTIHSNHNSSGNLAGGTGSGAGTPKDTSSRKRLPDAANASGGAAATSNSSSIRDSQMFEL